jgi:hypothetical protein
LIEHKHADVLRAIADGKTVQVLLVTDNEQNDFWVDISVRPSICMYHEKTYRVKPEEANDKTI